METIKTLLDMALELLDYSIFENTLREWFIALLVFVLIWLIVRSLVRRIHLLSQAKFLVKFIAGDYIKAILGSIKTFTLFFIALFFSTSLLNLSSGTETWIQKLTLIAVMLQIGLTTSALFAIILPNWFISSEQDTAKRTALGLVSFIGRFIIWSFVLLLLLDNLGVDITALVAGLGVGGIAVALAVQNILSDLLASLSIVLDKPFQVGDFVIIGEHMGNIERIGIKTTRVRSISGEQLVFSNSDLLSSRIRNFKQMFERRVLFKIGVTYQTPYEKLEMIPQIIKEAIESCEHVRFDRAHFMSYGDFALIFEAVFFVLKPDFISYADAQQKVNLILYKRFREEGVEFAYPTQTIFLDKTAALYGIDKNAGDSNERS